jgi:outer membrane protein OmpA-like peptidoglycan-associated protein
LECQLALAYSAWAAKRAIERKKASWASFVLRPCRPDTLVLRRGVSDGMRCNWRRWLWGLIPLAMVTWVAVTLERGRIEQDLAARATQSLSEDGSWAQVTFTGRDGVLSGRALYDEQPVEAARSIRQTWGVRIVENNAALPKKVEPFQWSARRRGNRVRLIGYVPNRATRQTIIGMAKASLPGLDIADQMSTARGVPPVDTWLAGLSFGLKQLALLKRGDVRLEDLNLTVTGEAEDADAYRKLGTALKSDRMPKGINLANATITPPVVSPFVWSAQFAGGQVVMGGNIQDAVRPALLAALKAEAPNVTVVDKTQPAEGAPQGLGDVSAAVLKQVLRLQSGEVEIKDTTVTVTGVAADEATALAVRAALRTAVPSGFKLTHQISAKAPPPPPPAPTKAEPEEVPPTALEPQPRVEQKADQGSPQRDVSALQPFPSLDLASPPPIPPAKDLEPPVQQARPAPPAPEAKTAKASEQPPAQAEKSPPAPPAKDLALPKAPSVPVQEPPKAAAEPKPSVAVAPPAPAPAPPEQDVCARELGKVDMSGHILFDTDSAKLDPASLDLLNRLASAARSCNGLRIAIEGHADTEGSARYNKRLSVRRARAVETYLLKAGMARRQLETIGYGFDRPVAPNDTPENMAKNRRIEFVIRR